MRSLAVVMIDHAERREQHEREVLGRFEPLALQVGDRDAATPSAVAITTTMPRNTANGSTRTMPAIVVIGPSSRTSCHCQTSMPAGGEDAEPATTRSDRRDRGGAGAAAPGAARRARAAPPSASSARSRASRRTAAWMGPTAPIILRPPRFGAFAVRVVRRVRSASTGSSDFDDRRRLGLAVVGLALEVGDRLAHRRLDAVEHRLRVEAEEQAQREQRHDHDHLADGRRRCILAFSPCGLAGERALERPQHVDRGEDHAEVATIAYGRSTMNVPSSDEELADEPGEPGQADAGEHRDEEHAAEDRRRLPHAAGTR